MKLKWEICLAGEQKGARILRIYSWDGEAELPETVEDEQEGPLPVRELADYAFSSVKQDEGREDGTQPLLAGNRVEGVSLPGTLRRIGRYAFYNCENLKTLTFFTAVRDLGAGLFTGCRNLEDLDVRVVPGARSCLYEVLSELNQTLRLTLRGQDGAVQAKLLIPEYFEESVENTPARIVNLEMHGCGHRYRYCFRKEQTPFTEYDALFPHVQVQEPPEIAAELAWYRLEYPARLSEKWKKEYLSCLATYPEAAIEAFARVRDMALLRKAAEAEAAGAETVSRMIEGAKRTGQEELIPLLMDIRHKKAVQAGANCENQGKKRRFEL